MHKLSDVPIANEGGNDGLYFEDTITAADLFTVKDGRYSFNVPLAKLIKGNAVLTDEELESICFKKSDHKPKLAL